MGLCDLVAGKCSGHSMPWHRSLLLVVACATAADALSPGAGVVALGPGASEVKLIAAKLAAKAGFRASVVVPAGANQLRDARALLYGREYAERLADGGAADAGCVDVVVGTDGLAEALGGAEGVIVVCDTKSGPISPAFAEAIFNQAANVKHCALLSAMGGGKGGGLFAKNLAPAEAALRDAAGAVPLSIVRAGVLKGGGPGNMNAKPEDRSEYGAAAEVPDFGLSRYYYDTLFELQEAMAVMAHDKFGLGAAVARGDPYGLPNPVQLALTATDFEPCDYDTSRTSAAAALVAALQLDGPGEFTVSVAAGSAAPSNEAWVAALAGAA